MGRDHPLTFALLSELVELLEGSRPSWHQRAACRGTPAHWWFPPPSKHNPAAAVQRARRVRRRLRGAGRVTATAKRASTLGSLASSSLTSASHILNRGVRDGV